MVDVKLSMDLVCLVAGPTIWNNLPEYLRDPELSTDNVRCQLKTVLFAQYWRWHLSTLETRAVCSYKFIIYITFTLHSQCWEGRKDALKQMHAYKKNPLQ